VLAGAGIVMAIEIDRLLGVDEPGSCPAGLNSVVPSDTEMRVLSMCIS
jgi:hypothetical protein